jgi:putative endonuclease
MYYVYAIKSVHRNYIYVGISSNIARRLDQHNKGQNKSTKPYRPFFLFFHELLDSREKAREREIYFKHSSGKRFLRKLLNEYLKENSQKHSCRPV